MAFVVFVPLPDFDGRNSSVLLDRNGELLGAAISPDEQWRFELVHAISPKVKIAVIHFEDRRFNKHFGVDPLALARALRDNIRAGEVVSGASTISMQVVRLSRKGMPRTLFEKAVEALIALRMELSLDKDEIFSLYVANAPYGGNVVGIEAAAWRYYARSHDRLSWAEAALFAVLPNSPALIHPDRNRDLLQARRDRLLRELFENGYLDEMTLELSMAEEIPHRPGILPRHAPHLLTYLSGKNPAGSSNAVIRREGDGVFRTTLDKGLQERAVDVATRHRRRLEASLVHNLSVVVLDVLTNEVLAYVGNAADPGTPQHSPDVDCARAPRSPGSTLKPFLYAGMLEEGELLPNSLVPDVPVRMGGFSPQNFDRTYSGAVPASSALARSLNVPAVRVLSDFGVDRFAYLLRSLGMTTLDKPASHYGLSLILGGSEATLLELTSMYAGLARAARGMGESAFIPPLFHLSHAFEETLAPHTHPESRPTHPAPGAPAPSTPPTTRVAPVQAVRVPVGAIGANTQISPGVAYLALQAMIEVERPGVDAGWRRFASSRRIAWKTGTSWGHRDAWAIGVSNRYAVGVWAGNAGGTGRPGTTGHAAAAPVLMELFGMLPPDSAEYPAPWDSLERMEVCARSGMPAGPDCVSTREETVQKNAVRASRCSYCRRIHCDTDCRARVHTGCEQAEEIRAESFFVLPPAMEWFFARKNSDYRYLPPWRTDCRDAGSGTGPALLSMVSPGAKARISVPRELDGKRGRVVFAAAHREPNTSIYWHLGKNYLGMTQDPHQMELAPDAGKNTLTLVDENGELLHHEFYVVD